MQVDTKVASKCQSGGSCQSRVGRKREGTRRESFVSRSIELPGRAKRCDVKLDVNMADPSITQAGTGAALGGTPGPATAPTANSPSSARAGATGSTPQARSYAQAAGSQNPNVGTQKLGGEPRAKMSKDAILEEIQAMPQAERKTPRENSMPFKLNDKYIQVSPWSTDYDPSNFRVRLKPVWVSIVGLSSILEEEGLEALKGLGRILHTSGQDTLGRSKFSDVRALILLNEEEEWPEAILMETEANEAEVEFELYYEPMPTGCFTCHQSGHLARFCPLTSKTRTVSEEELEEALKAAAGNEDNSSEASMGEDNQEDLNIPDSQTKPTHPITQSTQPVPTANPYDALTQMEDEEESTPDQSPKDSTQPQFDLNTSAGETHQSGAETMDYTFRQKRQTRNSGEGTVQTRNLGGKEGGRAKGQGKGQIGVNGKRTKASQGDPPEKADPEVDENDTLISTSGEATEINGRFWQTNEVHTGDNPSDASLSSTSAAKPGGSATTANTTGSAKAQARLKAKAAKEAQRRAAEEAAKGVSKLVDGL
ncbi:hypothetical protein R1sor_024348 [Riccia sorocarpa]|uniref:CCHC-type domain-containing protein n=1 Tax=Riccia sorocarpa TaxID=122646 RepID=A0ABD3GQ92_9MARC